MSAAEVLQLHVRPSGSLDMGTQQQAQMMQFLMCMGGVFARLQGQTPVQGTPTQRRSAIVGGVRRASGANWDRLSRVDGHWRDNWRDDTYWWGHGSGESSSTSYWSSTTTTEWAVPSVAVPGQALGKPSI